ncbi:nucleoside 2-deoxyribosyltransferase [Patescibacteria group bacterium]
MKIYFTASISGKNEYGKNYEKIIDSLKKLKYQVFSDHIIKRNSTDIVNETAEQRENHFKKVKKWIRESDVVIAEVSHPSTNVGYELSMALDKEKPVLALYVKNKAPVLLIGVPSEKLALVSYDAKEITTIVKENIKDLKEQMDVRFNFFISPRIGIYLDWIAKHRKIPRAVFLRRLIEEHLKKNKEYKG